LFGLKDFVAKRELKANLIKQNPTKKANNKEAI